MLPFEREGGWVNASFRVKSLLSSPSHLWLQRKNLLKSIQRREGFCPIHLGGNIPAAGGPTAGLVPID
jgi:hypothetical protein